MLLVDINGRGFIVEVHGAMARALALYPISAA
jgi:hypothetical protein